MAKESPLESRMVHMRFDAAHQPLSAKRKRRPEPVEQDDDAEVVIAPPAGPSATEVLLAIEAKEREQAAPAEKVGPVEIDRQVSLRLVLVLMTVVSIGLAGTHWLPAKIYSFACGLATLVGLGLLSLAQPMSNVAYLCWGAVLLIYVFSIIYAGVFG